MLDPNVDPHVFPMIFWHHKLGTLMLVFFFLTWGLLMVNLFLIMMLLVRKVFGDIKKTNKK